ncbi:hypothetical protein ACSTDW_20425, partial [Vibrio vulnificus]|uniref:hypothetical protein n=1 Tax=Vibrio vulnificus TaxID=672 RepID=UPI003ED8BFD6
IAFYHFRNPQLSPSVKDLIVKQEFSSKKSLTSCEGLLYKRQATMAGFFVSNNCFIFSLLMNKDVDYVGLVSTQKVVSSACI